MYLFLRKFYYFYKSRSFKKIDPYPVSTHFPILIGISSLFKINSVYETGSGIFSTGIFLNKKVFKHLISLNSLENDKRWFDKITKKYKKSNIKLVKGSISKNVSSKLVKNADLVFVDDSTSSDERAKTIKQVLDYNPKLVVIHDFENKSYRKITKKSKIYEEVWIKAFLPNTGIIYNKNYINSASIQK